MRFKDETAFNAAVRSAMRTAGLRALHVRETDVPGPLDLVIWDGHLLVCWMELKIDNRAVEPSQEDFIKNNPEVSTLARYISRKDWVELTMGGDYYIIPWVEFATAWPMKIRAWASRSRIEE